MSAQMAARSEVLVEHHVDGEMQCGVVEDKEAHGAAIAHEIGSAEPAQRRDGEGENQEA